MRKLCGTQSVVAKLLNVDRGTIARRENGGISITREASLALFEIAQQRKS